MDIEDYVKPYNKLLNIILPKKFKWFKKIELDDLKYGGVRGQKNFINPVGKIYVDSKWGYRQWREYHYESPFPYDEELNFGDIIGGDLSKEIQGQFKICFSTVTGEFTPIYMTFSWLHVILVDDDKFKLEEITKRIIKKLNIISEQNLKQYVVFVSGMENIANHEKQTKLFQKNFGKKYPIVSFNYKDSAKIQDFVTKNKIKAVILFSSAGILANQLNVSKDKIFCIEPYNDKQNSRKHIFDLIPSNNMYIDKKIYARGKGTKEGANATNSTAGHFKALESSASSISSKLV